MGLVGFVVKNKSYLLVLYDLEYMVLLYEDGKWKNEIDKEYEGGMIN